MTAAPALRLGILGTAKIARAFVQGVRPAARVQVTAVASRDADKALRFAADMQIPRHFASYEALLADPDIDAVYIPLPNALHAEWAVRAAQARKHVLCEKPLAASAAEARLMFAAARDHGVRLVEGFPFRAQPQTRKLDELIAAGTIGAVRLIQASFGFTLVAPNDIRWNSQLAGGALMDIGTYPVCLISLIAKSRPTQVQAVAHFTVAGVDRALAATLQFENGLLAQITCSFDAALHRQAMIVGSGGMLQTTYLNHTSAQNPGVLRLRLGTDATAVDSVVETPAINGFLAEAESFERCVREGPAAWVGASPDESVNIALTLDAIHRSARAGGAAATP